MASPRIPDGLAARADVVIATDVALGNGTYDDIHDVVLVDPGRFDRALHAGDRRRGRRRWTGACAPTAGPTC